MTEQYLWIAWQEAKKARRRGGLSYAELVSAGYEALVRAGIAFDLSKSPTSNPEKAFTAFARRCVHNAIADELKKHSRYMEKELPSYSLTMYGDVNATSGYDSWMADEQFDGYYRTEETKWDVA